MKKVVRRLVPIRPRRAPDRDRDAVRQSKLRLMEQRNLEPPYFRRLLLREPIPVHLPEPYWQQAAAQAEQLGITPTSKIVIVHAREPGYKVGREVQEKGGTRDDSTRNCRIDTYHLAIDYLIDRGYLVVRIGDPTMTPVERPDVVDLASSPLRTDLLELYCWLRSAFFVGCESGPQTVTYLMNKPCLVTNATCPIGSYPVRRDGLYILKRVQEPDTGRMVSLAEMCQVPYLKNLRNTTVYRYIDNTPEEILEAVQEMMELVEHGLTPSQQQLEFKALVEESAVGLRSWLQYVRKWGADGEFTGDGYICRQFVERYLYGPDSSSDQVRRAAGKLAALSGRSVAAVGAKHVNGEIAKPGKVPKLPQTEPPRSV
jgi:putative glycosyltransferase (TIGR04372 family)